jgi:regulation of enolase protein 1 (concanavalin A-like superfamily)
MSLARLLVVFLLCSSLTAADNTLRVSPDGRSLVKADGSAFFWLGDTAWELFHRLNREQAEQYLSTRANQGYTLIQAVALAELDGINTPNPYGHKPFTSTSPTLVPNEAYWQHVDWIVNRANALGLYIGLLPTWGDKWNLAWGQGPILFDTTAKAQSYGQFIGNRYRDAAVVWIMGGDRNPANDTHLAIIRAMAQGVEGATGGRQLMTFHPQGGATSATWFHNDGWLDLNMQQNGHCTNTDVWNRITNDRNRSPVKPVLDGEPLYESHPICFNAGANGYSNATDVRKFAWWNVFAGALGHTYGCHSVWQMYDAGRTPVNGPQQYWHQALSLPGGIQMGHVRRLMESRPFTGRVPDQSLLTTSAHSGGDRIQATRGADGGYAMVYSASGQGFGIDLAKLSGATITSWWYDPRTGTSTSAGSFAKAGTRAFSPPSNGYGNDWVLVLDDAARGYPQPGGPGNAPPSCQLTAPANGASFSAPATITLSATASDSNGSVVRVEFYAGGTKLGEDASAPYGFTWSNVPGGVHTLSARAVDNQGAIGGSGTATVTVTTAGFVLGVNLGGGPVTIEGNAWRSDAQARANGLTTSAPNLTTTTITPSPATDADTRAMLNSAIWGPSSFTVGQAIGNGSYDVSLWVMENYQGHNRSFNVTVEGTTVAGGVGNLALGGWQKLGPYRVGVSDGQLTIGMVAVSGDPHLMGFSVVSAAPANQAPACQLTAPTGGANYNAPATIALAANASDGDGSVARVEFYSGSTKIGEDTSAPYAFTWSNVAAGSYALSARAVDNQGAVGGSTSVTVTVAGAPAPGFVLGVNLNGGAVTIEGNAWRSDASARANGLTTNAPNLATTAITPSPGADADTRAMLNSAIWANNQGFTVGQALGNGTYDVYLWVIENYQSNVRRFDVRVEGVTAASGIGNLALGAWVKYGPYRTSVNDGRLDLDLVAVAGDPHLMGFAVFGVGSGGGTWSNGSVGSPGVTGSATQNGSTWTVRGGGDDIWNATDSFHFVHQPLNADGEITVRVASQTNTDPWAKAGVMIREGTAGNARHAMVVVTPGNGVAFQRRTSTGGASAHTAGSRAAAPVWLRLARVGSVITGYESGDGTSWVQVGSVALTIGSDVRIGLCVTSHNNAMLSTAVFESVQLVTAPAGPG